LLPTARLQELGYHVVIIPSDTQRAAIRAMQRVLATIARDGSAAAMIDDLASFKEREAAVDAADWLARERRYSA
jgi:2-methylisocitrate lyase-like PEP mutase family enzyme